MSEPTDRHREEALTLLLSIGEVAGRHSGPGKFDSRPLVAAALAAAEARGREEEREECARIVSAQLCSGHPEPLTLLEIRCDYCDRVHAALAEIRARASAGTPEPPKETR